MRGGDSAQHPMVDAVAQWLSRWGLCAPAILFLELHRPFSEFVAQFALLMQPVLGTLVGDHSVARFASWLSEENGLDALIAHIEQRSEG